MALGIKKNETRSWYTGIRGQLAIHASRRKMTLNDFETFELLVQPNEDYKPKYGNIIAVVDLVEVVPSEVFHKGGIKIDQTEASLGNYEFGRWVWITENVRRLREPVPEIGHQGFWGLTLGIEAKIRSQL